MWSSTYYFEVTVHQIFADLCPFESFRKDIDFFFFLLLDLQGKVAIIKSL